MVFVLFGFFSCIVFSECEIWFCGVMYGVSQFAVSGVSCVIGWVVMFLSWYVVSRLIR